MLHYESRAIGNLRCTISHSQEAASNMGGFLFWYNQKVIEITLLGEPKSTQHCYKYTCRGGYIHSYLDSKCVTLKEDYAWQARTQFTGEPLDGRLIVTMKLYHKTRRKADIDNFNKLVFDALTGIVYEDDAQIDTLCITKHYDKNNPRVELSIIEFSPDV